MKNSILALAVVLPFVMPAQTPPDFSGTWRLDPVRSRFESVPAPKSVVLFIDQHQSVLNVKMTRVTRDGESTVDFHLGAPAGAVARWDADRLVLESGPITWRFKRGEKDKIMTAVMTVKDSSHQNTAYQFYVRD